VEAVIPYWQQPVLRVGGLAVLAFGILVILAVPAGRWIVLRRARP
jgi:prolipoprotein diacylglyceryltransferase